MTPPPAKLNDGRVLWWAWSGEKPFGATEAPGSETPIYGLAICTYDDRTFCRFSCDAKWQVIVDSYHDRLEDAKQGSSGIQWQDIQEHRAHLLRELTQRIAEVFPPQPIPEYPPLMGIDPSGEDEYSPFANRAWNEVEPQHFASTTYDISPASGFRLHETPHMWSYFVPGFLTASLMHEREHDIVDSFMSSFKDTPVPASRPDPPSPWWGGSAPMENYTTEQRGAVALALEFLRDHGEEPPIEYDWKRSDERMLERWQSASKETR